MYCATKALRLPSIILSKRSAFCTLDNIEYENWHICCSHWLRIVIDNGKRGRSLKTYGRQSLLEKINTTLKCHLIGDVTHKDASMRWRPKECKYNEDAVRTDWKTHQWDRDPDVIPADWSLRSVCASYMIQESSHLYIRCTKKLHKSNEGRLF